MTPGYTLTVSAAGVLANDYDVDGDPLTAVLVSGPQHAAPGSFHFNSDGSFEYQPDDTYQWKPGESDAFTYRVSDGHLSSGIVLVALGIGALPDAACGDVTGPDAVPGNSIYTYVVRFTETTEANIARGTWKITLLDDNGNEVGPAPATAAVIVNNGVLGPKDSPAVTGSWVEVWFKNNPNSVRISLDGLVVNAKAMKPRPIDVNVVQVSVSAPQGEPNPFWAGTVTADDRIPHFPDVVIDGVKDEHNIGRTVRSANANDAAGLQWAARVKLTGPGPNHDKGLDHIIVGFIQHVKFTNMTVHFPDAKKLLVASATESPELLDYDDTKQGGPWYSIDRAALLLGSAGPAPRDLVSNDTPRVTFPLFLPARTGRFDSKPDRVTSRWNFRLDVAAFSDAANADVESKFNENLYWEEATATGGNVANDVSWHFDASGDIGPPYDYAWSRIAGTTSVEKPKTWKVIDGNRPRSEAITKETGMALANENKWKARPEAS